MVSRSPGVINGIATGIVRVKIPVVIPVILPSILMTAAWTVISQMEPTGVRMIRPINVAPTWGVEV